MSEIEDLDSLDNQSLHAKCMEYGMPNIPVTSSSRGVLLKRLKAVMSDPAAAAAAAVAKKANRRETIHSTRPMTPSKQSGGAAGGGAAAAGERKDERGTPVRTSRRTIAAVAAPSDVEDKVEIAEQPAPITGRRRSTAQKTITEFVSSEKESNELVASTAGKERRRSVRGESQTKVSPTPNVVASERPQTISEDDEYLSPSQQQPQRPTQRRAGSAMLEMAQQYTAAAAKSKQTSPYLRDGSIVILESEEDDDDDDLLRAVEQAEQQTKTKVTPSRTSRGGSQTQGSTAYRQQQAASISLTQPQREPQQKPVDYGFVRPLSGSMSSNIRSSIPASQPVVSSGSRQALDYSSTRYSSSVLPPLVSKSYSSALPSQQQQRYSTSSITTSSITKSSAYKPSSYVLNEQSDDAAGEASGDDLNTPFLSSFARNLERIKTEGIASPRYRGSRMSDNYQPYGTSQSMRAAGVSYWQRMDRKYHLRLLIILMILIMILAFFYVLFFN